MSGSGPGAGVFEVVRNTIRTVVTVPPFLAQHAWRSRDIERSHADVPEFSEAAPTPRPHTRLQHRDDGVGPEFMRSYSVTIEDPVLSSFDVMEQFRTDPNHFNSNLVAGFVVDDHPKRGLCVGDEFVVEIPGPWNGPVVVERSDDDQVLLATLHGHMEAGHIRFAVVAGPSDGGIDDTTAPTGFDFRITSWARGGDSVSTALHVGGIGKELQAAMWTAMCDRAVAIAGGRRSGKIRVVTEELIASCR